MRGHGEDMGRTLGLGISDWGYRAGVPSTGELRGLLGEEGFVAEDAVESGAADVELACGAELVAVVELQDVFDVVADDRVEGEIVHMGGGLGRLRGRFLETGKIEVVGADDSIHGFEECGFEHRSQFAHVAGPGMLEKPGQCAGAEHDGALLIADADAVEQGLGERADVFTAHAQGRNGEADGAKAEGEVRHEQALTGHLAERGLRRGQEHGAAGRAILQGLENAEQQALSGRGEQVDAVEIGEAGEGVGIGVGDQPLAGIAALESSCGQWRPAEEVAAEGLLARAVFAFDGGYLNGRGGHICLGKELAPGGADADDLHGRRRVCFDECEAGGGGLRRELSGALHDSQPASPP